MPEEKSEVECCAAETMAGDRVMAPSERAVGHIRTYMLAAAGAGMVPVPVLDMAGVAALQCRLVQVIAREYGIGFKENAVKTVVASLLGSAGATRLFTLPLYSLVKVIPVVGPTLSGLTMPAIAAASTYALGKVFVQHFETGGTLLDFDAKKIAGHYARLFEEGKLKAADCLKDKAEALEDPVAV